MDVENKVTVADEPAQTPNTLLQLAINNKLPIEHLERLMALQERWEKNQSKKAFDESMALFQSKCPIIIKSKEGGKTRSGVVAYYYAPLDVIISQTKDLIAECGFSYFVKTDTFDNQVKVTVVVKHKLGHSEESTVQMPFLVQTGVMSETQVVAGTLTFAKRYAFCNAFGIMTGDEDNDGRNREMLLEKFNSLIKNWAVKDEISKIPSTIKSSKTLQSFISKLPQEKDTDEFRNLIKNIEPSKVIGLWKMWEKKCISVKWQEFLDSLKESLSCSQNNTKIQSETITESIKNKNTIQSINKQ